MVTDWQKEKTQDGLTLFPGFDGAVVIDMDGNVVQKLDEIAGFPNKPGENQMVWGTTGVATGSGVNKDQKDLVRVNASGDIVERIAGDTKMLRQHHDFEIRGDRALVLSHRTVAKPEISDQTLTDDVILEYDREGNLLWSWNAADHFDEFGFSDEAGAKLRRMPGIREDAVGDWLHINALCYVGENRWYDAGDTRFHPDNILFCARVGGVVGIINRADGSIVWKIGPDPEERTSFGYIQGPHCTHFIPRGLPGEGNLLLADSGVIGTYLPDDIEEQFRREGVSARVLEINPITLETVWEYKTVGKDSIPYSAAQRLANGNTLITIAREKRILEVTADKETVWQYRYEKGENKIDNNVMYRAYRLL